VPATGGNCKRPESGLWEAGYIDPPTSSQRGTSIENSPIPRNTPTPMTPRVSRRDFLATGSALATVALMAPQRILAATAGSSAFEKLIPPDKRLDPKWVASLFARGTPKVHSGDELRYIGMPVSGLCSGHLYLGGDGKIWLWDIFNIYRYTSDAEYKDPIKPFYPVSQGFAIRVGEPGGGEPKTWTLDAQGFPGVTFRGEYPIGIVDYRDASCPVTVRLEAFSPFSPLDTDDSSLPATILRFTVRNPGAKPVTVDFGGWLENRVGIQTETLAQGFRRTRVVREPGLLLVEGSVEPDRSAPGSFDGFLDIGTLGLALLEAQDSDRATAQVHGEVPHSVFTGDPVAEAQVPFYSEWYPGARFTGAITRSLTLAPGEESVVTFAITWHFPNLRVRKVHRASGRFYANRFKSAQDVAGYLSKNHGRLHEQTRLWRDTWYDSTLPYWFLDRTFANASTLATSTAFRFSNGRFYGWEGVGNCTGTCTHVWSYEQTMGRLFPELDRALMEQACFNPGVALHPDGQINFRDETMGIAVDGQAGTILRAYRLHQMSADGEFLRKNWPRIRLAVAWLMEQDTDGDGILDRNQSNTLDAEWYGKIAWLSGLYIAALRAAEEMAVDRKDAAFAASCHARVEAGRKNIVGQLWNGRYFIQTVDPKHEGVVGSYAGCEIDQVFGQSWAFQAGLGRILPEAETREALRSLWRYNFATDVGPYRAVHKDGRWFAMPGEAGLLMCTQPDGTDRDFKDPPGSWTQVYLNECMNGFEHQAAGHMIWEGLVLEGLAVERAVHDRYDAAKRNPWNEIECGNHYARSMASFGVFLAACGYEYHGPKGSLGFAPRIHPEDFRAAFVTAEGWGSFSQKIDAAGHAAAVELKRGSLSLRTLALATSRAVATVEVRLNGGVIPAGHRLDGGRLVLEFPTDMRLVAGDRLSMFAT